MYIKSFEEFLNEKTDLSKYSDLMVGLNPMESFLLMAKIIGDKRIIEVVKSINNIHDFEGEISPISNYKSKIYDLINKLGRKKFGQENWDKYIYSNIK